MINSTYLKIKNNPYTYFLLKFIIFFIFIFILDYSIGNIFSYYYFKQESGAQYRTTYSIGTTRADLLIFGSSRAMHHYQPNVFEKRLNLKSYNVGRGGHFIFYQYAILKSVLKRYSPKIIILDIMRGEFNKNQINDDYIFSLYPYYRSHPEIRPIVDFIQPLAKYKLLSLIYTYRSSIFAVIAGNVEFNQKTSRDNKGYVPLTTMMNGSMQIDSNLSIYEIDSTGIKIYESFIQDCINSKVKLYITLSPCFNKSIHTDYSIIIGQEIARKYNILFFDYSKDSIFVGNSNLFADWNHLNVEGAKLFSNMVIDKIIKTNKYGNN